MLTLPQAIKMTSKRGNQFSYLFCEHNKVLVSNETLNRTQEILFQLTYKKNNKDETLCVDIAVDHSLNRKISVTIIKLYF